MKQYAISEQLANAILQHFTGTMHIYAEVAALIQALTQLQEIQQPKAQEAHDVGPA